MGKRAWIGGKLRRDVKGFTLIELLITLALLMILGAVAVSIYTPMVNKTVCSKVEMSVSEAMLASVKQLTETGLAPADDIDGQWDACADGLIACPSEVSSIIVTGMGTTGSPITVNGTATGNKCPKGQRYVLRQDLPTGQWK